MSRETIFISKNQLTILIMALMSLTRDDEFFEHALAIGVFKEDDIYEYIETLKSLADSIENESGVLIVSELGKEITDDCINLWGNSVDN